MKNFSFCQKNISTLCKTLFHVNYSHLEFICFIDGSSQDKVLQSFGRRLQVFQIQTLIASSDLPQSNALLAISEYETPGASPSLSAMALATCSSSSSFFWTCTEMYHFFKLYFLVIGKENSILAKTFDFFFFFFHVGDKG